MSWTQAVDCIWLTLTSETISEARGKNQKAVCAWCLCIQSQRLLCGRNTFILKDTHKLLGGTVIVSDFVNQVVELRVTLYGVQRKEQTLAVAIDLGDAYNRVQLKLLKDLILQYGVSLTLTRWTAEALSKRTMVMQLGSWSSAPYHATIKLIALAHPLQCSFDATNLVLLLQNCCPFSQLQK